MDTYELTAPQIIFFGAGLKGHFVDGRCHICGGKLLIPNNYRLENVLEDSATCGNLSGRKLKLGGLT